VGRGVTVVKGVVRGRMYGKSKRDVQNTHISLKPAVGNPKKSTKRREETKNKENQTKHTLAMVVAARLPKSIF
jgi:hypothetical protein